MTKYHVHWEVDFERETPKAAALAACNWRTLLAHRVFTVVDEEGNATRVDLEEILKLNAEDPSW